MLSLPWWGWLLSGTVLLLVVLYLASELRVPHEPRRRDF